MIPAKWQAKLGAEVALSVTKLALIATLVLASIGFGVVQTVRIEGFKFWPIELRGWKPRALAAEKGFADLAEAQVDAGELLREEREKHEQENTRIAKEHDREIAIIENKAFAAADAYIADNLESACVPGPAADRGLRSETGTGAEDNGSRVYPTMPADPLVSVAASDVRACAGAVAYALGARSFVLELEAASLPSPEDEPE